MFLLWPDRIQYNLRSCGLPQCNCRNVGHGSCALLQVKHDDENMSTFYLIMLKLNKSFTEILIKLSILFWGNSII